MQLISRQRGMWVAGRLVLCVVFALFNRVALAQDDVPTEPSSVTAAWSDGHLWQRIGLADGVLSMTVSQGGTVLALSEDGAVWRKGQGLAWRRVLEPILEGLSDFQEIDEERLLLEAESVLSDQADYSRATRAETKGRVRIEDEDGEEDVKGIPIVAPPTLSDDEATDLIIEADAIDDQERSRAGQVIWAAPGNASLILCDRYDGIWRSADDGMTWDRADHLPPVFVFHQLASQSSVIYAGTAEGLRMSPNAGRSWNVVPGPLSSVAVRAFTDDTKQLWAATGLGLFTSLDGTRWVRRSLRAAGSERMWALTTDPFWETGLWLASPQGLFRSDDGGLTARPSGHATRPETTHLLALSAPGHLLCAGPDGIWESRDGGIRWLPISFGLANPEVRSLVHGAEEIFMGGPGGVFVLRRTSGELDEVDPEELREAYQKVPKMGELVDVALRRHGLAITNVLSRRRIVASMLLPKLTVTNKWVRYRYITADHVARSNKGALQVGWSFGVTACFGNCSSSSAFSELDVDTVSDTLGVDSSDLADLADVTVVGDEVYVADSAGSLAPVAANVAERMTRYRSEVANRISELAIMRRRLVGARAEVRSLSLKDQVAHELDIQETGARLDVYTNGYFTRVLEGS